jgi:tyrosyl-DNA phosphodiesterase 2
LQFADELANMLPKYLPLYHFVSENNEWQPFIFHQPTVLPPADLQIITWNVDAKRPHRKERLRSIIDHLATEIFKGESPSACYISFQEIHKAALRVLLRRQWVRDHFLVTPINPESWVTGKAGLVSLITKNVPVSRAFIIDLPMTTLGRQALFLDLHLSKPAQLQGETHKENRLRNVRIANCHLESGGTYTDSRAREKQICHIAKMLNVSNLDAYICAGSLCSCLPDDTVSIARAGFEDSYKTLKWLSETWGEEIQHREYPPGRLDRIVYFPTQRSTIKLLLTRYRLGVDTFIRGRMPVSDHYGILVTLHMENTVSVLEGVSKK